MPDTHIPQWSLGDRMRKSMEDAGIGVQEMADELGVSRGAVGKWIHGRIEPKRPVLIAWALRTGVPLEWLLGDGEAGDEAAGRGQATEPVTRPTEKGTPPPVAAGFSSWARRA